MNRVMSYALDQPWAMTEGALALVLEIAAKKLDGEIEVQVERQIDPDAVAVETGELIDGARRATVRDGVAIVPVVGPIFRRANMLTEMSGATSVELLARDLRAAMDDDAVRAVMLDVDSPGGEVNGISEMADLIFDARDEMPVRAFVSGLGASGAYWLASSASEVTAADTALVGSIGVRTAFIDTSEREREQGIRRIEFVSSQSPRKAPDPTSDEGRAQIQEVVDGLAEIFVADVARNRDVSRGTVLEDFGAGAVFVAGKAERRGMIDGVTTFESALSELQDETSPRGAVSGFAADQQEEETMAKDSDLYAEADESGSVYIGQFDLDASQLREAFPEAVEEIEAAALETGAEEERERIQAIHELDVADGYGELIAQGMFDPEATAESVSRAILQAQAEKRRGQLKARREDEEGLDELETRAGTEEEVGVDQEVQKTIAAAKKAGVLA